MPEILTESFCERCGTRYTFEAAEPKGKRLGKLKVLSKGFVNFVSNDETSFDEAFAEARSDEQRELTNQQLDAFHQTFQFCMSCRQYTCANCWNDVESRCLSCAPHLGTDILDAPFRASDPLARIFGDPTADPHVANGNGNGSVEPLTIPPPVIPPAATAPSAWPSADLIADTPTGAPVDAASPFPAFFDETPAASAPAIEASEAVGAPIDADVADAVAAAEVARHAAEAERAAQAERELQVEAERQRELEAAAEVERQRQLQAAAEAERQRELEAAAEAERQRQLEAAAEAERQHQAELAAAEAARAHEVEAAQRQRQAEAAAEAARAQEADAERQRQADTEALAAAERQREAQAEADRLALAAIEAERQREAQAEADRLALAAIEAERLQVEAERQRLADQEAARRREAEAAAAAAALAAAAQAPGPTPSPGVRPDDQVGTPAWQIVAPEPTAAPGPGPLDLPPAVLAPQPPLPAARSNGAAAATNGVGPASNGSAPDRPAAQPQWPMPAAGAAPEWPSQPVQSADAMWAASSQDVVSREGTGVQSCVGCGLALSSSARFCRRCGTPQH